MNAESQIDRHEQQRNDRDERDDQTRGDRLFRVGDPAHTAAEHQGADYERIAPLAQRRQRRAARQLPEKQQGAGKQEARRHQEVGCEPREREADHEIGRAPDQPGRRQASEHQRGKHACRSGGQSGAIHRVRPMISFATCNTIHDGPGSAPWTGPLRTRMVPWRTTDGGSPRARGGSSVKVQEYAAMDAVAIAARICAGELDPLEVTDAAIAAIELLDARLNALVIRDFERARARARAVRRDLPLAGVPFLIKDVTVHCEEWPTTHSSRFFADAKPRPDSEIVRRWRDAGVILLGKTNTPEFCADDFVTEPGLFRGATLNPWNAALTRSAARAAAPAAAVVERHGSRRAWFCDVGGSIRSALPPAAASSVSNRHAACNPAGPLARRRSGEGISIASTCCRAPCATALRSSMPRQDPKSALRIA